MALLHKTNYTFKNCYPFGGFGLTTSFEIYWNLLLKSLITAVANRTAIQLYYLTKIFIVNENSPKICQEFSRKTGKFPMT